MITLLTLLLLVAIGVIVYYYKLVKEGELRYQLLADRVKTVELTHNSTTQSGAEVLLYNILYDLKNLLGAVPLALSKGKLRNGYEVQSEGKIKTRLKIKDGDKIIRETNSGVLYYKFEDKDLYISINDLKLISDAKTLDEVSSILRNKSVSKASLESFEPLKPIKGK